MELKLKTYRSWLDFLHTVEAYFADKAFLKVRSPTLVLSGAMESSLHPFILEGNKWQLPTSPEFSLKKLWLSGLDSKIFEISASFRSFELGQVHLDEFSMLEFYLSGASFEDLRDFTCGFLSSVLKISSKDLKVLNINELFGAFIGFELVPDSDEAFLKEALNFHSIRYPESANWSDLFHILFLEKIEPTLSKGFIALKNYPPQLSALAKLGKGGWSERIEFFYKGIELGNGYNELLDADEILNRWNVENRVRAREGVRPHPIDFEFIELHKNSKVDAGVGMAIGLERLFWLTQENPNEHIKVWPFES